MDSFYVNMSSINISSHHIAANYQESDLTIDDDAMIAENETFISHPLYDIPKSGITVLIILYVIIALTAIIGNTMVVYVIIRSKKLRGVTNYFIANLASADIMIAALAIPFTFQAALLQKWVLPRFMCAFCPFIQTLSVNVSIFTLVAVALDRFRAVIFPLRARTSHLKTKLCIIPIWIFSFVLSIPTYIALDTREHMNRDDIVCDMINMDIYWWKLYNHTLVILQYFVPLCIIVMAYTIMGVKLYNDRSDVVCARSDSTQAIENRKKVVKMMVIVVLLFGFCWLPYQMYNILSEVYPSINDYFYINVIFFAFHMLAMSNSCFNPFIYFLYSELYNSEMRAYIGVCFKSRPSDAINIHSLRSTIATENETFVNPNANHGGSANSNQNSPLICGNRKNINSASPRLKSNNNQRRSMTNNETVV